MRLLLLLTLTLCSSNIQGQTKSRPLTTPDRAIVTPKRSERVIGRGEDAFTNVALTPIVTGLPDAVLKRIRHELTLEKVLGKPQFEMFKKKNHQLTLDYEVTYNRNYILGLTFSWVFWSRIETTRAFDLSTGKRITLADLFREDQMGELANLIDHRLRTEIAEMIRDYKGSRNIEYTIKAENMLKVTTDDLEDFSIDEKGITLFYHAGFHHTASWAEPKGRYFFAYTELKPFLKPHTPVSQFLN